MVKLEFKTVYGPHNSRCHGLVLGIDPIMPPKRCPYNCIYCPIGRTYIKTFKPALLVKPDAVVNDLKYFIENEGILFEKIVIWGSGDPMLNFHTPLIINNVKKNLIEHGCKPYIVIKTSAVNIGEEWIYPVLENVDEINISLATSYTLWRKHIDPVEEKRLDEIISKISSLDKCYRDKTWFELVLYRYGGISNANEELLEEFIGTIGRTGIRKIYVKTIDRPSRDPRIKPVKGRLFNHVVDKLVDRGYIVKTCRETVSNNMLGISNIETWLFNHILRKPLSTKEIISFYGDNGVRFVEKLFKQGIVNKINWEGQMFFTVRETIKTGLERFLK